jgi:DNA-binding response OmpR family regulator
MQVLLIEDDVDFRASLAKVLRDAGHVVREVGQGSVALALLQEHQPLPDVVVLDLTMPNKDGQHFRVCQLADPRLASIPTLVTSAVDIDTAARAALGDALVFQKALSIDAFLAALDAVTDADSELKRCRCCGREHDADSWQLLQWVAEIDNGRGAGERLELRNCACGSTLAWELGRHAVSLHMAVGPGT